MSRQFELTPPPLFLFHSPSANCFFFQLCFSVKTISSSLWTRARPRLCRPVSPTSTVLNAWWRTGLSFYALPLPQSPLLAPPCGAQGPVTRGRVSPTSNKSQRGASTKGHTDPPFDIFIFPLAFYFSIPGPRGPASATPTSASSLGLHLQKFNNRELP